MSGLGVSLSKGLVPTPVPASCFLPEVIVIGMFLDSKHVMWGHRCYLYCTVYIARDFRGTFPLIFSFRPPVVYPSEVVC